MLKNSLTKRHSEVLPAAARTSICTLHSAKKAHTSYTSDLSAKRSLHVFTGANRSLGTTTAPASSKHSMAEPMAVSSWKTAGVSESLGLIVFLFLMRGSCSTPLLASSVAFKLGKFTHRLFVLKNLCLHVNQSWSELCQQSSRSKQCQRLSFCVLWQIAVPNHAEAWSPECFISEVTPEMHDGK